MFLTIAYHLIDNKNNHPTTLSEDLFRSHLNMMQNIGINFITLSDALLSLNNNDSGGQHNVLLTFDDGYKNTVDLAMPLLLEHKIPAVMCVCSSYLSIDRPTSTIHPTNDFASVTDIDKWLSSGNEIGGHSKTHKQLTKLLIPEVEEEIYADKEYLQRLFHIRLFAFFYPFGAVNRSVEQIAAQHYDMAFATNNGFMPFEKRNHLLYRYEVKNNTDSEKLKKILLGKLTQQNI